MRSMPKTDNALINKMSNPKAGNRESGIELLRIVLMIMIICYHFFSLYLKDSYYSESESKYFYLKLFFTTATVMGVDCFVFISGFFGLKFKLKQVFSFVVQAIFYSYLCLLALYIFTTGLIEIKGVAWFVFPISSGEWWFLTAYILLYFLAPFLNAGIKNMSKKQFQVLLIGFLYLNCFSNYLFNVEMAGHLINFIFIYLLARYINIYKIKIDKPLFWFIILVCTMFLLNVLATLAFKQPILTAGNYTSILTISSAVSLFFVFKNIRFHSVLINKIAPLCFGVYLFHFNFFVWNIIITPILIYITSDNLFLFVINYIIFAIIVFLVSIGVEKIRQVISEPLLRVIGNKIDKLNLNS